MLNYQRKIASKPTRNCSVSVPESNGPVAGPSATPSNQSYRSSGRIVQLAVGVQFRPSEIS